ncbi:MAG: archaetidylserine decarboxylase [bacterium]
MSERRVPPGLRRLVLGSLANVMHMDMGEAEWSIEDYESFQDLFCRGLAPGLRECEGEAGEIASPVDGHLVAGGTIRDSLALTVKGSRYSVPQLLGGDSTWASRFMGGAYQVFYLSPKDYHRMHSPVNGRVVEYRWIRGDFWPVMESLADRLPNVYCDNERVVTYLKADAGVVAMVKVAAFGVGYISLRYLGEAPGDRRAALRRSPGCVYDGGAAPLVRRGEEIASFGLGSTVVLLYEPERVSLRGEVVGRDVRVGQSVAQVSTGRTGRAGSPGGLRSDRS